MKEDLSLKDSKYVPEPRRWRGKVLRSKTLFTYGQQGPTLILLGCDEQES